MFGLDITTIRKKKCKQLFQGFVLFLVKVPSLSSGSFMPGSGSRPEGDLTTDLESPAITPNRVPAQTVVVPTQGRHRPVGMGQPGSRSQAEPSSPAMGLV